MGLLQLKIFIKVRETLPELFIWIKMNLIKINYLEKTEEKV
jgi:hypothetical protein